MKTSEMIEKISEQLRGVRIKLQISHLLCVLVYHTCIGTKSMLRHKAFTLRPGMKNI